MHDNMPVSLLLETDKVHVSTYMKLLQDMGQEFDREEVLGPKVNDTLARVVNSGIRAKLDRNVAKELCEKFVRPRNCEALVVPKINSYGIPQHLRKQPKMLTNVSKLHKDI